MEAPIHHQSSAAQSDTHPADSLRTLAEDYALTYGLAPAQLKQLSAPLQRERVSHDGGRAHLEGWDVRRWLIRIFGYTGWDFDLLGIQLVHETNNPSPERPDRGRWTVVYRASGLLTVKDKRGNPLAHWADSACGDATNQPSVGDAHDLATKTSVTQALKRCAVNLGDQFGLSLYDDGKTEPVVNRTLADTQTERPT